MLKKISNTIWINTDAIESVSQGFKVVEFTEREVETTDLEVFSKIEKLMEKLQEECEVTVKVSVERTGDDGSITLEDEEETIKVKLCDITREEYGDIKLCDKKDKLEMAIKDLSENEKIITKETFSEEKETDGYTIFMKSGKEYTITEQAYIDNVRDYILI